MFSLLAAEEQVTDFKNLVKKMKTTQQEVK